MMLYYIEIIKVLALTLYRNIKQGQPDSTQVRAQTDIEKQQRREIRRKETIGMGRGWRVSMSRSRKKTTDVSLES